jgi:hypothetical protein
MNARTIAAFLVGILFGLGLLVSGMADPARVIGFLDVAGAWDPTLLFVMAGALAVAFVGYRLAFRRARPVLAERFDLPKATRIDRRLLAGSAMFGVGWGLSGFCPGPGLTALSFGDAEPFVFVAAMLAGMALFRLAPPANSKAA